MQNEAWGTAFMAGMDQASLGDFATVEEAKKAVESAVQEALKGNSPTTTLPPSATVR
jgi:hypothetical protein